MFVWDNHPDFTEECLHFVCCTDEAATRAADLRVLHQLTEEEDSLHPLLRNEVPEVIHRCLHG